MAQMQGGKGRVHQPCTSAVWSAGLEHERGASCSSEPCPWDLDTESGCPKLPLEVVALTLEIFSKPKKYMNLPFLPEVEIVPL